MALVLLIWWLYIHQWIEMCICALSTSFSSLLNPPSAWTLDGAERIPVRAPPPKTGTSYSVPQHVWFIWILGSQTRAGRTACRIFSHIFPLMSHLYAMKRSMLSDSSLLLTVLVSFSSFSLLTLDDQSSLLWSFSKDVNSWGSWRLIPVTRLETMNPSRSASVFHEAFSFLSLLIENREAGLLLRCQAARETAANPVSV